MKMNYAYQDHRTEELEQLAEQRRMSIPLDVVREHDERIAVSKGHSDNAVRRMIQR